MAVDKGVDSARLDGAMTATANKIREKSGSSDPIPWDQDTGFAAAVDTLGSVRLESIAITTPPTKTAYKAGEAFNSAGMVVTATYSNGAKLVCTGYAIVPSRVLSAGQTSVTIQYTEGGVTKSASQAITVTKTSLAVPYQSNTLTYNGSSQKPTWTNYNSSLMVINGSTSATNAGTYIVTFRLTDTNLYQWSDGTTAAKTVYWVIGKAAGKITLNKTSISLDASAKTATFTVTRNGTGKITATSSNTSVATVSPASSTSSGTVTFTVASVNDANGSATITISVAADTNYTAPANVQIPVSAAFAFVFGVMHWYAQNTSTALTRLTPANDPNGYVTTAITTEPNPAIGTGSGSSPFDSYSPWKDMEECNVIARQGANLVYKKSDSNFSRTHNTMIYIPEFYYKIVDDGVNSVCYYISTAKIDGFEKHPGSGRYVGRYHSFNGGSITGQAPTVSITRAAARTKAHGTLWGSKSCLYDFATYCAIQLLYLIEFADWNSQAKIGQGCGSGSLVNNGGTDSMTYHTGTAAASRTSAGPVQYRGIEGLWSNCFDWVDGINFSDRKAYVCTDPTKYADDTTTGYTDTGITLPSGGWITRLGVKDNANWAMIPDAIGGSETTCIPDYVNSYSGWRVLCVGGNYNSIAYFGLFYFYASDSSISDDYIGSRLLYIP